MDGRREKRVVWMYSSVYLGGFRVGKWDEDGMRMDDMHICWNGWNGKGWDGKIPMQQACCAASRKEKKRESKKV